MKHLVTLLAVLMTLSMPIGAMAQEAPAANADAAVAEQTIDGEADSDFATTTSINLTEEADGHCKWSYEILTPELFEVTSDGVIALPVDDGEEALYSSHNFLFNNIAAGKGSIRFTYASDSETYKVLELTYDIADDLTSTYAEANVPTFTVALVSNPSTGYVWIPELVNPDTVECIDYAFIPGDAEADTVGVPGTDIYTFIGVKPGKASVNFYSTKFTGESEPEIAETVNCTFEVDADGNLVDSGYTSDGNSVIEQ